MAKIEPINDRSISDAAGILTAGGLVAFPTETVYGLGADATNDHAVARIFEAKKRPTFNPLIVHLPSPGEAWRYVEPTEPAVLLAAKFWPGALTMVLPLRAGSQLAPLVSAGLNTAAIRVPADPRAQRLLDRSNRPIAAPSANRSGSISPTSADHVAASLGDQVDLILDGGSCSVGLESTIIDLSLKAPVLLRPGGISVEDIELSLGQTIRSTPQLEESESGLKSPGMMRSHYAPQAAVRLQAISARPGERYLSFGPNSPSESLNLSKTGDLVEAAANLFAHLHTLDADGAQTIAVAPIPEHGLGRAINDRLRRAAAPRESGS